jgi:YD repeat-containing protein
MDRYGNRWVNAGSFIQQSDLTAAASTDFDATTNRLKTSLGWSYDIAVGNMTKDKQGNLMAYDAENRMSKYTAVAGTVTTYGYDGDGRRITKTTGSATTTYVYDASGQLIAEYGGTASAVGGTQYLTADHLGSTRLLTGSSGSEIKRFDYLPYGEEIVLRGVNYGSRTSY